MSYLKIRDEIKETVENVDGIGKVHGATRYTNDWAGFYKRFRTDEGDINAWEIQRVEGANEIIAVGNADGTLPYRHQTYDIRIKGMIGVRDTDDENNSADVFDELVDQIRGAFDANTLLQGLALLPVSLQIFELGYAMRGDVLVHDAILQLPTTERTGGVGGVTP